jgi:hypothetical protein
MVRPINLTYRIEEGVYDVLLREGFSPYPDQLDPVPIGIKYKGLDAALAGKQVQEIQKLLGPNFTWTPLQGKNLTGPAAIRRLYDFVRTVKTYETTGSRIRRAVGKDATEIQILGTSPISRLMPFGLFSDTWKRAPGKPWRLVNRVECTPSL